MAKHINSITEDYRHVQIECNYWDDGDYEIGFNSRGQYRDFESLEAARAYIDNEYLKHPYMDLAIDIWDYSYSIDPWNSDEYNIFDIAEDLEGPENIPGLIECISEDLDTFTEEPEVYADEIAAAGSILERVYSLRDNI